jgi:alpha-L-arabinofuranosidase
MRTLKLKRILAIMLTIVIPGQIVYANEPDSAYIFSYTTHKNRSTNGLHFAWSIDKQDWHPIGPEFSFLTSDFGSWGTQKKLIKPFLFRDVTGLWHCLWSLNDEGQFAHSASHDLISWKRQSYPLVMVDGNIVDLEMYFDYREDVFVITWGSAKESEKQFYKSTTSDFKQFSPTTEAAESERLLARETINIGGDLLTGTVNKVTWETADKLIKWQEWNQFKQQQRDDNMSKDPVRFHNLSPQHAKISLNTERSKRISDMLIGVFFEDINYAADGGIYAELVQNRGFEYHPDDKKGNDKSWNSFKAWNLTGEEATFIVDTVSPVHQNNKHYAILDIKVAGAALINEGFDGITVSEGETYNFSVFARAPEGHKSRLTVRLTGVDGEVLGESKTGSVSGIWKKHETRITATKSYDKARLEVIPQGVGKIALDMVSLFPQKTFMGRKNGLRHDLAQAIADLKPRFVRFPGGCVAHGDGLGNIYRWNRTVGPLEARVPQRNIWNYHQSAGLGYFEYFQFCKDIGAEPLPVLAAGVPCQNSSVCGHGQQGGIPMCQMDNYVQEILDLIEWANGDKQSKWGRIRADAGHPEPFNLKYIGIGNEDLITDIFEERFTMIYETMRDKHPEITVIGTVGPFNAGTDYIEGWDLATRLKLPMVDEHYYQTPGWFIHNQDFYDRYDRSKSKVYLGEYAAHLPGRPNNIETALSEAIYLLSVERNADVVALTSYAPLLAKEGFTQWNPNLIYFSNTGVKPTVGYYVQQMFGQNPGDVYIPSQIKLSEESEEVSKRVAVSVTKESKSNDLIIKLANLLPVSVTSEIDLTGLNITKTEAELTFISGNPDDKTAKPVSSKLIVSEIFQHEIPPYSFSVIRIR